MVWSLSATDSQSSTQIAQLSMHPTLGPVQTMAKLWEEKRLDQWKCRNAQSRPLGLHTRGRSPKDVATFLGSYGAKSLASPGRANARLKLPSRGRTFFFIRRKRQISDFKILQMVWGMAFGLVLWGFTLLPAKGFKWIILINFFSPKASPLDIVLVQKSDASPLDLGIVWTGQTGP